MPAAIRHAVSTESAIHEASSAYVMSSAHVTVRPPTASATRSAGRRTPTWARSGAEITFATCRISGRFRQLRVRLCTQAGRPSASGNSVGKRSRVPADAPRQP